MGNKTKPKAATAVPKQKSSPNGCSYCLGCFIGFVIIVFGVTAVNLHQFVYNYRYHDFSGSGEFSVRDIVSDLSSLICRGYEVTPTRSGNVYLIEGNVKVNHHHANIVKRKTDELVPGSLMLNNAFYLLEGSQIHVNGCKDILSFYNDDVAKILIFKGYDSWNQWSNGKCPECPVETLKIKRDDYCRGSNAHLTYKIEHRDTYYIALYKKKEYFSGFEAAATIKQTTFDVTHARERCHMTSDCYLNLTYGKDFDVVVQFPKTATVASFGTECKYRTMFWVGIFAILPAWLVLMVMFCCCCCVCCDKKKPPKCQLAPENATNPLTGSKADLLGNELPPGYQSFAHNGNIQSV